MLCVPARSAVADHVPRPLESTIAVPSSTVLSKNATDPVLTVLLDEVTCAVNLTKAPGLTVLEDRVRDVLVGEPVATCTGGVELLVAPAQPRSPAITRDRESKIQ